MHDPSEHERFVAVWDRCGQQWKWIFGAVLLIVLSGFGVTLFGNYLPKTNVAAGHYVFGPLMIVGAAICIGLLPLRVFDHDHREEHFGDLAMAHAFRFAPIAGLIAWLFGMAVWIRHLYGWTPQSFSFFVTNPFGIYLLSLFVGFVVIRFIVLVTEQVAETRSR